MPAGLQVYDQTGDIVLDTTDYTFKVLGSGETGTRDGCLEDSAITADTQVIITSFGERSADLYVGLSGVEQEMMTRKPKFTVTAGKISWVFGNHTTTKWYIASVDGVYPAKFIYGVYQS